MAKKVKSTKRAKRGKQAKRKASKPLVTVEPECQLSIRLTGGVGDEPETIRRLAHRLVDVMADNGLHDKLEQSVSNNLVWMVDDFVIDGVTALIHEAQAAAKEAPRG